MIFEEMWRKKMEAMKARERTTTTKGSLITGRDHESTSEREKGQP